MISSGFTQPSRPERKGIGQYFFALGRISNPNNTFALILTRIG
jgi:hypothetical protein